MTVPFTGTKWGDASVGSPGGQVSWSFAVGAGSLYGFDAPIGAPAYQQIIRLAFDAWERAANIDLVEAADSAASNIRLGWERLDGVGKTLGETYWQISNGHTTHAEIAFDQSEPWSADQGSDSAFYAVALHEIGHAIGLNHSDETSSIMFPRLTDGRDLSASDKAAIQKLYGPHVTAGNPPVAAGDGFDAAQYLANYADLRAAFGQDLTAAVQHFSAFGKAEHRLDADPLDYIASFKDLIAAFHGETPDQLVASALTHYQSNGFSEGRRAAIDFDAGQYLANYADLRAAFADGHGGYDMRAATLHYIEYGAFEGRGDWLLS